MPSANVNGINLYYEVVGNGPPIAFIHGGYGGAASSVLPRDDSWVDALKDAYTVVTYDRRSAGRSTYPDSEHTMDLLTSDLRALLDHLGISKSFVIGSSAGGPISLTYALTYPDALIGLILPNTSARMWQHDGRVKLVEQLKHRFELLVANGPNKAFDMIEQEQGSVASLQLAPQGAGPRPPGRAPLLEERQRQVKGLTDALSREDRGKFAMGELRNQAAYADSDLRSRLSEINVPTIVLHGDLDTQVPFELGKELAQMISGAEFITVPGSGHGVMQWEMAMTAIRAFCDNVSASQ